ARDQSLGLLPLLGSLQFHVLFHSRWGFFSPSLTVLLRYRSPGVFSIARVQHSTASPSSTTLVLLSTNPVLRLGAPISLADSTVIAFAFFSLATKMFQFARLSLACPWIQQQFERILVVPEDPATGEPGTESFPPFSADSLALVLRMSDCPSPTLTAQPESVQLKAFHLLEQGSMVGP
ncbi:hypothetical protein Tco_0916098, partial [Tanacetum coccineum]